MGVVALSLGVVLELFSLALNLLSSSLEVDLALTLNSLVELVLLILSGPMPLSGLRVVLIKHVNLLLVQ